MEEFAWNGLKLTSALVMEKSFFLPYLMEERSTPVQNTDGHPKEYYPRQTGKLGIMQFTPHLICNVISTFQVNLGWKNYCENQQTPNGCTQNGWTQCMKGGTTVGMNAPWFTGKQKEAPAISSGQPNRSLNHQMILSQQSASNLDLSSRAQDGQHSPLINLNMSHRSS
eukprot:13180228-Ditylum_brightwellii.AAC.1